MNRYKKTSELKVDLYEFCWMFNANRALSIPLNQRYKLANDMAKVMIEEKKLQQMKKDSVPVINPLLALLEDDEE